MSQVDASIPLSVQKPDFMSPAQAISLQSMVQQMQAQKLQQTQSMQMLQKQSQIQQIASQPGAVDNKGVITLDAINKIRGIDWELGEKAAGQRLHTLDQLSMANSRALADDANKLRIGETIDKSQRDAVGAAVSYVDSTAKDAPIEKKDEILRAQIKKEHDRQRGSGIYPYSDEQWTKLESHPYTYNEAKAFVTPPKEVAAQQNREEKAVIASEKAATQADQAAERQKNAAEHLKIEQERLQLQKEKEAKKSESESGRAAVFTNRMVTSANEAMKSLKNIVQLPVTSSRGIFGGRQQEGGLLAASKESLTNKLTSEEVQLYNVMSSGIQRNLASIEAVGLMPSGSLTHQMDSVVIKEGDTELTKASKLAEIRQILEGGLEPIIANPKVPKEMKDLVKKIMDEVTTSVPYTQEDVIKLMSSNDPDKTLGSIVKGNKRDPDSGAIVRPHAGEGGNNLKWTDADEKRLQELEGKRGSK